MTRRIKQGSTRYPKLSCSLSLMRFCSGQLMDGRSREDVIKQVSVDRPLSDTLAIIRLVDRTFRKLVEAKCVLWVNVVSVSSLMNRSAWTPRAAPLCSDWVVFKWAISGYRHSDQPTCPRYCDGSNTTRQPTSVQRRHLQFDHRWKQRIPV